MYGKGGNDTYTHFVRGNSGNDGIIDSGGKDHLLLLNYTQSEVRLFYSDINKNGKADSLGIYLGKGSKNFVLIYNAYDDTKSKAPFRPGRGWIEDVRVKQQQVELPNPGSNLLPK